MKLNSDRRDSCHEWYFWTCWTFPIQLKAYSEKCENFVLVKRDGFFSWDFCREMQMKKKLYLVHGLLCLYYFDIWRLIRHKIKLFQNYIEDWRSNQSYCYICSPTSLSTKIISSKNHWGMCIYSTLCFNTREPKTNDTIVLSTLLLLLNLNCSRRFYKENPHSSYL